MMNTMQTMENASPETIVALDAVEANHPDAHKLLVGVPCTVHVGSDSYSAKIVGATKSLHTLTVKYTTDGGLSGKQLKFRKTKRSRYYVNSTRWLTVGVARTHWDPHF